MLSNKIIDTPCGDEKPLWLAHFIETYQHLAVDNLSNLETIYHQDIVFQDPLHMISGFNNLADYFAQLYQNVTACNFVIKQVIQQDNHAALYWTMTYQHKHLNGGQSIEVEGHSIVVGEDNKVIYHRDYIDLGQMLYEHIPLLGGVIRWLKKRVSR